MIKHFKHHYHHRYHAKFPRHHKKIFIFDLLLIASIIVLSVVSTYFFLQKPTFQFFNISLSTDAQKIIEGSKYNWELHVTNTAKRQLNKVTISLTLPETFRLATTESATSTTERERALHIDKLRSNETTLFDLSGMVLARAGESIKIIARVEGLTEKQEPFFETHILNLQATDPALKTSIEIPKTALAGETFPIIINYTNQSETKLSNPSLRFELPSTFELGNKPNSLENKTITIPALSSGANGTLRLTGAITTDPRTQNISIGLHTSADLYNYHADQEDLAPTISINPTGIKTTIKTIEKIGTPGETLHAILTLEHSGTENFDAVTICVPLNSSVVVLQTIKGDGKLNNNEYCFTSNTTPELAHITKNFSHEWRLSFTLQNIFNASDAETTKNSSLKLTPHVTFYTTNSNKNIFTINGEETRVPITTTLNLRVMGRFFTNEGDQLGRGPLPPQIGKTTKYWISWALSSSANAIKNIVLKAILPSGVEWDSKSSVNNGKGMSYNSATREVSWFQDLLEPTTENCACAEGGFQVSLTPAEGDSGLTPVLLKKITLDATDVWTDAQVHANSADISTDLATDPFAKGKGHVQK